MVRYSLFTLLCVVIVAGCKQMPGAHLPKKTMEDVLFDITLAESYSTMAHDNQHVAGTKNVDSLAVYYKEIFQHNRVTKDDFESSMVWYKKHPDQLDTIYAHVLTKMTKVQTAESNKPKKW